MARAGAMTVRRWLASVTIALPALAAIAARGETGCEVSCPAAAEAEPLSGGTILDISDCAMPFPIGTVAGPQPCRA